MLCSHFREISKEFIPESVFGVLVTKGYSNVLTVRESLKVKVACSFEIFIRIEHNTQWFHQPIKAVWIISSEYAKNW